MSKKTKSLICLLLLFLGVFSLDAQQSKRLTVQIQNGTVLDCIKSIEGQTDFTFLFSNSIGVDKKVSVNCVNQSLDQVLSSVFGPIGIAYDIQGNQITLRKASQPSGSSPQKRTVTGRVIDGKNDPVIAAGVQEKGGSAGTITDADGRFKISVPEGATLVFSSLGYKTTEVEVNGNASLNIVLRDDSEMLADAVVVGYGTMRRRDLTGSITHVETKELTAYPVTDPIYALQGRVPGVVISQNTGSPEGDYSIRIRGVNSIKGGNDPLYIIDGIPASTSSINTYDIESLEVLKDASATAIYGSRGANGVVLITTKKGKTGQAKVQYDVQTGMQYQIKKLDLMNAQEWMTFYNTYLVNSNTLAEAPFSQADIAAAGEGTDWQKEVFRPAPTTNHSVTVSGGSDNIRYFISGSAMLKDGLVENSYFNKYNIRSTIDANVSKFLDLSLGMGYSLIDKMNQTSEGGAGGSTLIAAAFSAAPTMTPRDADGNYNELRVWYPWSSHELRNPILMANEASYQTVTDLTDANMSLKFKPVKGLTFTANFATEISNAKYQVYTTEKYLYQLNSATAQDTRNIFALNEDILNYKLQVGDHSFDIMGAFSYQQNIAKTLQASGTGFISDVTQTYDIGAAANLNTPSSSYSQWVLMSWLGRFNYVFRDKYMATISFRADGSSRYSPGQRWGYFPSGALAWRVSDEPWMKGVRWISDLKLRAGYGVTGSSAISAYATQNLLISGKAATGSGNMTSYYPSTSYPNSLKWETTAQYNVGVDLGILDQKVKFTADWYNKYTYNLLNTVSLPWSSGYVSTTENIGSMRNTGIELDIDADIVRTHDFGLTAQFNIAHNHNEIVKLAGGEDIKGTSYSGYSSGSITILREGEPIGAFWLYDYDGINPETGRMEYKDMNGDGALSDDADRIIAGSPFPDFTYGLNVGVRYRRWDFNFFLQGSQGGKVYNLSNMRNMSYGQGMNIEKRAWEESWKAGADNSKATFPVITNTNMGRYSTRFLEDGSYLRLKNITLAYNIPVKRVFSGLRVFVTAQNLLTLTKNTGVDPEVSSKGGDINAGIDHLSYPNVKTASIGATVNF